MAEHTPPPAQGRDMAAFESARHVAHNTGQSGGLIERRLGDYHLHDLIGVGGMADVYRGYDLILMRAVAVKVLSASLAVDADYVNRFRAEARRVAALSHPHLVPVYHAGEETIDGQRLLYLVMPLLHESLEDVLQRKGKLPLAEAVRLVLQVADGLQAAHRHGLVHRDVKPGNILLDTEGQALLADFGLAREMRRAPGEATRQPWGTPEYMAPEQLHGDTVDQRADIYSLGVVFYELLTGKRPFDGESAYDIAAQALSEPLKPPSTYESAIPPALERVVIRALAREPGDRYPGMAEFALALRQAVSQQSGKDINFTAAATVPLPDHFWSSSQPVTQTNRRRSLRWALASALATVILVAGFGGALAALQHRGQDPHDTSNAQVKGPIGQTSPTSGNGLLPDQTPIAPTPETTNTPHAPTSTATAKPTSALTFTPTPLVLTPDPTNPKTCIATQAITNNTNSSVGWAWQKPAVSGFHFQIDGKPSVGWPTATTTTPPGGQDTLVVTSDCKPEPISYAILVKDSLGGQYTFVMTLR